MTEAQDTPSGNPQETLLSFVPVQIIVSGKPYTYKCGVEHILAPRDLVVVSFGTKGNTLGIVESVGEIPLDPNVKYQYKWVLAKVNLTDGLALAEARADAEAAARGAAAGVE